MIYFFDYFITQTNNVTIDVQPNLPKQIQLFHKALTALPGAISLGIATAKVWTSQNSTHNYNYKDGLCLM